MTIPYATINHGRWVAECPHCHWALKVKEFDKPPAFERFGCASCGDGLPPEVIAALETVQGTKQKLAAGLAAIKELGRPLTYPEEAETIEAILSKRLLVNRNWTPGETLDKLKVENMEHKI